MDKYKRSLRYCVVLVSEWTIYTSKRQLTIQGLALRQVVVGLLGEESRLVSSVGSAGGKQYSTSIHCCPAEAVLPTHLTIPSKYPAWALKNSASMAVNPST